MFDSSKHFVSRLRLDLAWMTPLEAYTPVSTVIETATVCSPLDHERETLKTLLFKLVVQPILLYVMM
jgi:hypothetical protein